jgi:hypothetical protein
MIKGQRFFSLPFFIYRDACISEIGQLDTIAGDWNALQFSIICQIRRGTCQREDFVNRWLV